MSCLMCGTKLDGSGESGELRNLKETHQPWGPCTKAQHVDLPQPTLDPDPEINMPRPKGPTEPQELGLFAISC